MASTRRQGALGPLHAHLSILTSGLASSGGGKALLIRPEQPNENVVEDGDGNAASDSNSGALAHSIAGVVATRESVCVLGEDGCENGRLEDGDDIESNEGVLHGVDGLVYDADEAEQNQEELEHHGPPVQGEQHTAFVITA
eukprot:CAMPEP_0202376992 /NCGR_PEP_ID=MMETSP1127-20130417/7983_1 /ASSEMBLY_ACC=CAM_ASM_000462 /TAXON_ID=3047 /ORGANISM="Dunaliella tertiolecta, Strain CCMP1320" /LENGTH=140 /DNA_ID=CAMNT_0048974921 /DNA_START=679 /DNA_END=1100 /DNA_ORIENTATION=+